MSTTGISDVTVTVGDNAVTFRRRGISRVSVANIVGTERDHEGNIHRIWLDRLVHRPEETEFHGWRVSGAYVTELTRAPDRRAST